MNDRQMRGGWSAALVLACCSPVLAQDSDRTIWYSTDPPAVEEAEQYVENRLARPVALPVGEYELGEFVRGFSRQTGLQMVLDHRELENANVNSKSRILVESEAEAAKETLYEALHPLALDWMIHGSTVTVTSSERASNEIKVRVYPVRDLTEVFLNGRSEKDFDSLIDVIVNTVDPDSWDENGGKGTISPFAGNLVFRQTREVHLQVAGLLAALRRSNQLGRPHFYARGRSTSLNRSVDYSDSSIAQRLNVSQELPSWRLPRAHQ